MSVGPNEDLVKVLLTKLRSKAWFWLFRQTELKRGLGHAREVAIESVVMKGDELEVRMKPTFPSTLEGRAMGVLMRLSEGGNLSVTTHCENCGRPYCWHSAALLGWLSDLESEKTVRESVEKVEWEAPVEAVLPTEPKQGEARPVGHPVIELRDVEMRPVLLLKRVEAQVKELSRKNLKTSVKMIQVGVAVPTLKYAGCEERFLLVTSRLVGHFEFTRDDGRRVRLVRDPLRERSLLTEMRMIVTSSPCLAYSRR